MLPRSENLLTQLEITKSHPLRKVYLGVFSAAERNQKLSILSYLPGDEVRGNNMGHISRIG